MYHRYLRDFCTTVLMKGTWTLTLNIYFQKSCDPSLMALLTRHLKLSDHDDTQIFTFVGTKSVTRDLSRDITSKDFRKTSLIMKWSKLGLWGLGFGLGLVHWSTLYSLVSFYANRYWEPVKVATSFHFVTRLNYLCTFKFWHQNFTFTLWRAAHSC